MTEDPWKEGDGVAELSVTLKYGKGYEDSWIVVKGETAADVKRAVEEATGLSGEGMTLADLTHNAGQHVRQLARMGTVLGGTVLESGPAEEKPAQAAPAAPQEAQKPAAAPAPSVKDLIAQAGSQGELSDLYLKHKSEFDSDKDLMAALGARAAEVKK